MGIKPTTTHIDFITAYADQSDAENEIVIPEDFSAVTDEELSALHTSVVEAFSALYGEDGSGLTPEDMTSLAVLTQGVDRLQAELNVRAEANKARQEEAAALAAKVGISPAAAETETLAAEETAEVEGEDANAFAAKDIRINLGSLRSKAPAQAPAAAVEEKTGPQSMKDLVFGAEDLGAGFSNKGVNWSEIGLAVDRRLASFNRTQYESAAARNQSLTQRMGVFSVRKPFDDKLKVMSNDPAHVDQVIRHAMDEKALPGGSLVASGGWCAPSEVVYDLCELESRDGLVSLPEINVTRGGINFTTGPDFATLYANTGFIGTEAMDIAGDYDAVTAGVQSKPCYHVTCQAFTDKRLGYAGVCLTAGLLQQRGYPELIARTIRGALVAHDHRVSGDVIAQMVAGSTAVTMPANQVGATAPILTAISLQVEHYRAVNRLARSVSLEAIFPFWTRAAIRADLARRQGVDLLGVSDAQIADWFAIRGIAPQFVYNWQDPSGAAGSYTAFPANLTFLLYAAGTWVKGASDIITLDTIYDSVKLGVNDFTALFTEEGYLVAKLCTDSRAVTVNICPDGATHGGVSIACDGSQSGTAQV